MILIPFTKNRFNNKKSRNSHPKTYQVICKKFRKLSLYKKFTKLARKYQRYSLFGSVLQVANIFHENHICYDSIAQ